MADNDRSMLLSDRLNDDDCCRSQPYVAPERDYAELSQLVRAATESPRQHAPAHHRPPTAPAAAPAAAGNGLVLGNSALNARYMGQQQQQVNHPAVAAVLTLTLLHSKMFDVGDLPFGNCVLKTGMIKWPLKLYVRFLRFKRFFTKSQNMTSYVFRVVARVFSNAGCHQSAARVTSLVFHLIE